MYILTSMFYTYIHNIIVLLVILCFPLQVAKSMGPGHTVVTCLCDSGQVGLCNIILLVLTVCAIIIPEILC